MNRNTVRMEFQLHMFLASFKLTLLNSFKIPSPNSMTIQRWIFVLIKVIRTHHPFVIIFISLESFIIIPVFISMIILSTYFCAYYFVNKQWRMWVWLLLWTGVQALAKKWVRIAGSVLDSCTCFPKSIRMRYASGQLVQLKRADIRCSKESHKCSISFIP
jgi:hypothetical protein